MNRCLRIEVLKKLSEPSTIIFHGKSWENDLQVDPAAAGVEAARAQLIGCSVERGDSGLWRWREMTSGENREEEYRCSRSVQEPLIVVLKPA